MGEGAEVVGLLHPHLAHLPLAQVAQLVGHGLEVVAGESAGGKVIPIKIHTKNIQCFENILSVIE